MSTLRDRFVEDYTEDEREDLVLALCINAAFSSDQLVLGEYYLIKREPRVKSCVTVRYVSPGELVLENFDTSKYTFVPSEKFSKATIGFTSGCYTLARFEVVVGDARFREALMRAHDRLRLGEKR